MLLPMNENLFQQTKQFICTDFELQTNTENTSINPEINKPIKNQDIKNPRPNET